MRKSRIAFAAVLSTACATAAWGQQAPTGVQGFYGGGAAWTFYNSDGTQSFVRDDLAPDGYNHPFASSEPFSLSATANSGGASAALGISATPENGNMGLHGSASASFDTGSEFEDPGAQAEAAFDLYAYDTFYIGGTQGAVEQFQYALTLNGSAQGYTNGIADASLSYGGLGLFSNANWTDFGSVSPLSSCSPNGAGYAAPDGNPCGRIDSINLNMDSPASQTLYGILTLVGGSTVQLGELLWARPSVGEGVTSQSAVFDASNTGFFTLAPITPGASFTTASGLSYAQSPEIAGAVPEPSTWALMLLGFGAIGLRMRRRKLRRALLREFLKTGLCK
jgi:hypothetical protein